MRYQRTEKLIEKSGVDKLKASKVLVFGVGGVGGYTVEALARAGVGRIDVVDGDTVSESNINRQIIALSSTIGEPKVEVIKNRIKDNKNYFYSTARTTLAKGLSRIFKIL